jgi:hypothetical protein
VNRQSLVKIAESRYPGAGWVAVEGHHDEIFVVSGKAGRAHLWDREQGAQVAIDVVSAITLRLGQISSAASKLGQCNRAYAAVQVDDGGWVVVDEFMRFDDPETLPFDPPGRVR